MRLNKKLYLFVPGEETYIGDDWRGAPIYETTDDQLLPIRCEIEPYSSKLTEQNYGLFVEVTNRIFTKPDKRLKINEILVDDEDKTYKITEILKYDRHYEVLINRGDYYGD